MNDPQGSPITTIKQARGPDPGPRSRAPVPGRVATEAGIGQFRPVPRDEAGVEGVRPTPDAHRGVYRRGSRDKKQDQHEVGGGFAPRERGVGPAERVRSRSARMQHCDKAGLNAGLETGDGGKGYEDRTFPSVPHVANHQEACLLPLTSKKGTAKGRPPNPVRGFRRVKTRWRHRPPPSTLLSGFPPQWYEKIVPVRSPPESHRKTKA